MKPLGHTFFVHTWRYSATGKCFQDVFHPYLQLALEEEDVWRGVLNWAKYGAGVAQPTAHWTEEERLRVCQQLQGVINHVRLLLIGKFAVCFEIHSPVGAASQQPTDQ